MSKVEFNDLDITKIEEAEDKRTNFLKMEPGENIVRIMPPWAKGELYYRQFKVHFNINVLQNYGLEMDWFAEACLTDSTGSCPLCALAIKSRAAGTRETDSDLLDVSKKLRAKKQFVSNAVNMEDKGAGVQVFQYGKQVRDAVSAIFQRKGNITHPVNGYNLVISKNKLSATAEFYTYSVSIDETEDVSKNWDVWSGQLTDLTTIPTLSDLETVAAKCEHIDFSPISAPKSSKESKAEEEDVDSLLETLSSTV